MASAYQYWRLSFNGPPNGGTGNYISLVEWNFYDINWNVISQTGITASASSALAGWAASQAFDGNTGTGWAPSTTYHGATEWLQAQFTSAVTVVNISLTMRSDSGAWLIQAPTAFQIQGSSDGTTWTTLVTYTGVLWLNGAGEKQYFWASTDVGDLRQTHAAIEVMLVTPDHLRVSHLATEVVGGANPRAKVSHLATEVVGGANPLAKVSQCYVEVMYPYIQATPSVIMECLLP